MMKSTRTAIALLVCAQGFVGCDTDRPRSPVAPSPALQTPQPPSATGTYTLTASTSSISPGGVLSVSWTATNARSRDWIGFFTIGAAACDHGWSESTYGAASGTRTLTAPTQPGQYEFRYHLDDGCNDVARSSPVTVTGGG
jgi:hypothetical protein